MSRALQEDQGGGTSITWPMLASDMNDGIMHLVTASGPDRIGNLILHSPPVLAALAAIGVTVATWFITSFLNRKSISYRASVDEPFALRRPQATASGPVRRRRWWRFPWRGRRRRTRQPILRGSTTAAVKFKVYVNDGTPGNPWREVPDPHLVVLRIRNAGFVSVSHGDVQPLLMFTFGGRVVYFADVIDPPPGGGVKVEWPPEPEPPEPEPPEQQATPRNSPAAAHSKAPLFMRISVLFRRRTPSSTPDLPEAGERGISQHIELASFLLEPREWFTVRVILGRAPEGEEIEETTDTIEYQGKLPQGRIEAESRRYRASTRSLVFRSLTVLSVVALIIAVSLTRVPEQQTTAQTHPRVCPRGDLVLKGSTAFAPTATTLRAQFLQSCHGPQPTVTVIPKPSIDALNALIADVGKKPQAANYEIAMSDGPAPAGGTYRSLVGTPVGVIIFTVVVNQQTRVYNLTTGELRKIFTGAITYWSQRPIGGPDLPVSIVSRHPGSGSRRAFDQYVLGPATPEPPESSYDCIDKNEIPTAKALLCEKDQTSDLLQEVATLPGAIGYAQTSDVEAYQGTSIQPVRLDNIPDTIAHLGAGRPHTYQFWTVEYLYTYGTPLPNSLAAAFLAFMNTSAAKYWLDQGGYTPCTNQHPSLTTTLCAPGAR